VELLLQHLLDLGQFVQPIHQPGTAPPVFQTTIQLLPNLFWHLRNLSMSCFHNHFVFRLIPLFFALDVPSLFHHSPFTGANDEKVGLSGWITRGVARRLALPRAIIFRLFKASDIHLFVFTTAI